jgi:hypothetical protein
MGVALLAALALVANGVAVVAIRSATPACTQRAEALSQQLSANSTQAAQLAVTTQPVYPTAQAAAA